MKPLTLWSITRLAKNAKMQAPEKFPPNGREHRPMGVTTEAQILSKRRFSVLPVPLG
jgi:hypothetical protein